jgi:hypothetical protein
VFGNWLNGENAMNTQKKAIYYLGLFVFIFLVGVGMRWIISSLTTPKSPMDIPVVKAEIPSPTPLPTDPVKVQPTLQPAVLDAGADLKRGTFFSADINQQLGKPIQEQEANQVKVSVSNIVRQDTRAFVKVCMQRLDMDEPLDFGTVSLEYPDGRAENFFVNMETDPVEKSRCLVLEFVGVPVDASSGNWKLTMEWVGFVAPDEGTECTAYQRRAQQNDQVQKNGIKFSCNSMSGSAEIKIVSKSTHLSDQQAMDILNQAVSGVIQGPWVFEIPVK